MKHCIKILSLNPASEEQGARVSLQDSFGRGREKEACTMPLAALGHSSLNPKHKCAGRGEEWGTGIGMSSGLSTPFQDGATKQEYKESPSAQHQSCKVNMSRVGWQSPCTAPGPCTDTRHSSSPCMAGHRMAAGGTRSAEHSALL